MPLFSVITITKANPQGFARTRESVEAQSFRDFEWVVIDGDAEPDQGIYDAMNKGMDRARGDYLIFMNAGDVFAGPDILARIAPHLKAAPDFVYGDALESGHYKKARHDIRAGMITHHQAMVYRATKRRYDLTYTIAADYKFTLETVLAARDTVYLPFAFCIFEAGGVSQRRAHIGRCEQTAVRRELGISAPFYLPLKQRAATALKNLMPSVYWWLRR